LSARGKTSNIANHPIRGSGGEDESGRNNGSWPAIEGWTGIGDAISMGPGKKKTQKKKKTNHCGVSKL